MSLRGDLGFELELSPSLLTVLVTTIGNNPTPADLAVGTCGIFKNSVTGRLWLACNDGGVIKKRQLT